MPGPSGLAGASDRRVWAAARAAGEVLVTRDEDFVLLSIVLGPPPKVVWLDVGNLRNAAVVDLLSRNRETLSRFAVDGEHAFLVLSSRVPRPSSAAPP